MTDTNDEWLHGNDQEDSWAIGETGTGDSTRAASSLEARVPYRLRDTLAALLAQPVELRDKRYIQRVRREYPRAYAAWSPYEDDLLRALLQEGFSEEDLCRLLQRQPGGLQVRILLLTQGPEAVQALNDARDQEKAARKEARLARRQERASAQARHREIDVQLAMVAPHFEAWYALLQGGASIRVLDGATPVFTMTPTLGAR